MANDGIKVIRKDSLETFGQVIAQRGNENFVVALAKSHTEPLQSLAYKEISHEAAARIYADVMRVANILSRRHGFALTSGSK